MPNHWNPNISLVFIDTYFNTHRDSTIILFATSKTVLLIIHYYLYLNHSERDLVKRVKCFNPKKLAFNVSGVSRIFIVLRLDHLVNPIIINMLKFLNDLYDYLSTILGFMLGPYVGQKRFYYSITFTVHERVHNFVSVYCQSRYCMFITPIIVFKV